MELDTKVNIFTSPDHQLTERTVLEVLREATITGVLAKLDTDPDTAIENARGARELLRQLDQDAVHIPPSWWSSPTSPPTPTP